MDMLKKEIQIYGVFLDNFSQLVHSKQFTVLAGIKTKPKIARASLTLTVISQLQVDIH